MTHTKQKCCECKEPEAGQVLENGKQLCGYCGLPLRPSVEPKSRAELIEEIVGEFENFYIGSSQRRIIKEFLVPTLLRISDASMDAVEVEDSEVIDNHKVRSRDEKDGWNAARTASKQKRRLFTK